jgi:hypothetical protein
MLNETLIHFFREFGEIDGTSASFFGVHLSVNDAKMKTILQWLIQSTMICGLIVANAMEDIGLRTMA